VQKAQKLKLGGIGFDVLEYVDKVKQKLRVGGEIDWSKLDRDIKKACLLTPAIGFMYGPIKIEAKQKVTRKASAKLVKDQSLFRQPEQV
jgi:hypothetical protein